MQKKFRVSLEFELEVDAIDEEDALAKGYECRLITEGEGVAFWRGKSVVGPDDVWVEEVDA